MWNRAKTVLATMILITASLTVYFSICSKTFTQNVSKTPKDLLPNTVRFIFHWPPPPDYYTSYIDVSPELFISLALELNATIIYYWSFGLNVTNYAFKYDVSFHCCYYPPPPNVYIYFGTVYEGYQQFS